MYIQAREKESAEHPLSDVLNDGGNESGNEETLSVFENTERKSSEKDAGNSGDQQENPSVGIILCSSKDKDVVEYSLSKNMSQTLISKYKLKLIDKKLLETKLSEMKKLLENKD